MSIIGLNCEYLAEQQLIDWDIMKLVLYIKQVPFTRNHVKTPDTNISKMRLTTYVCS